MGKLSDARLNKIGLGDELGDREAEFKKWSQAAYRQACVEANLDMGYEPQKSHQQRKIITKLKTLPDVKIGDKKTHLDVVKKGMLKEAYFLMA